jgi:hypothetical protein
VVDTLYENQWIHDITGALSTMTLVQYVWLWERMQNVQLHQGSNDKFIWRWSQSQQYTASSAYQAFFHDQCGIPGAKVLSKIRAPLAAKFFIGLTLLGHPWTSERLQHHQLQNNGECALCSQVAETIAHLLLFCSYSCEVWFRILRPAGFPQLTPQGGMEFTNWWLTRRKLLHKDHHKGFDTLLVLIYLLIWKQQNDRVFNNSSPHAA